MRAVFFVLAAGAALVSAQGLSSLPPCGKVCIANMLQIAQTDFGCAAGNATCYCTNQDFGYGVRDCSLQSCPTHADAEQVIAFGTAYCKKALAAAGVSGTGGASGTSGASATNSLTKVPITTSALTEVVTSNGKKATTTTGSTTIYGYPKVITSTESGVLTSGGKTFTTATGTTTITQTGKASATSALTTSALKSTATSKGKKLTTTTGKTTITGAGMNTSAKKASAASSASSSATSKGAAAAMTAAPGLLGAAALAILAL